MANDFRKYESFSLNRYNPLYPSDKTRIVISNENHLLIEIETSNLANNDTPSEIEVLLSDLKESHSRILYKASCLDYLIRIPSYFHSGNYSLFIKLNSVDLNITVKGKYTLYKCKSIFKRFSTDEYFRIPSSDLLLQADWYINSLQA